MMRIRVFTSKGESERTRDKGETFRGRLKRDVRERFVEEKQIGYIQSDDSLKNKSLVA